MRNDVATVDSLERSGSMRFAFVSATFALAASFAASAAPIPLFNVYRADDELSNADISMAVVTNSLGTIAALLVLGRLSNHVGRRATAFASFALLAAGCALLLNVQGIGTLLTSRFLMGVGTGLASSGLTSYIVDAAPRTPEWLASVASSQTPMLGLTLGAVASGALVQFGPWPRELIYLLCIVLLIASLALISASPETTKPVPGAWRSLRPQLGIPARARPLMPVAAVVFIAPWATGAFYQALVPALIEDELGSHSPLLLGVVFATYLAASVVGAPVGGRYTPAAAQRFGMAVFLLGWVGIIAAIIVGLLGLFIVATVLAGAGQGIAISAATRGLLYGSTQADRAPIFSTIFVLCYSGAAFPILVSGQLSTTFSLPQISIGYGVLVFVATGFTLAAARNPTTTQTTLPASG